MKKITILSILATFLVALSFTSCDTGNSSDSSSSLPSTTEARAMLSKFAGTHNCGILFPGDSTRSIAKDSTTNTISINASDSTFTITNFAVKNLAKYVKDTELSKAIAALPNQTLKGKLYPYNYSSYLFCSATENITFKNADNKDVTLMFYTGYTNYALAGLSSDKTSFLLYLTPGTIYVDKTQRSDALYTGTNIYGYSYPYIMYVKYTL